MTFIYCNRIFKYLLHSLKFLKWDAGEVLITLGNSQETYCFSTKKDCS